MENTQTDDLKQRNLKEAVLHKTFYFHNVLLLRDSLSDGSSCMRKKNCMVHLREVGGFVKGFFWIYPVIYLCYLVRFLILKNICKSTTADCTVLQTEWSPFKEVWYQGLIFRLVKSQSVTSQKHLERKNVTVGF